MSGDRRQKFLRRVAPERWAGEHSSPLHAIAGRASAKRDPCPRSAFPEESISLFSVSPCLCG
jgi:hypothetical protein